MVINFIGDLHTLRGMPSEMTLFNVNARIPKLIVRLINPVNVRNKRKVGGSLSYTDIESTEQSRVVDPSHRPIREMYGPHSEARRVSRF